MRNDKNMKVVRRGGRGEGLDTGDDDDANNVFLNWNYSIYIYIYII